MKEPLIMINGFIFWPGLKMVIAINCPFTYYVEKACYEQFTPLIRFLERLLYLLAGPLVIEPPAIPALVHPLPAPTFVLKMRQIFQEKMGGPPLSDLESSLSDCVKVDFRKEIWVLYEVFRNFSPAHGASLGLSSEAFHTEVAEDMAAGQLDWIY